VHRIDAIILEVADLAASARLYREVFGVDLHVGDDNEMPGDRWVSGAHAATSWKEGAFLHFSLYQAKAPGQTSRLVQIGFSCADVYSQHDVAVMAGVKVVHPPRQEPWGIVARYEDLDGNIVSLTQH
jgi:predicted enzyme related to lactoylglutathione lyase